MTALCDTCQASPCAACPALFPTAQWTVLCPLMGADKYAAALDIAADTALTLVRRPHNGRDGNAIAVNISSTSDSIICGYLPTHFTSALAPLIDAQYVSATVSAIMDAADDDDELSGDVDESVALPNRRDVRLSVRVVAAAVCVKTLDVCETDRIGHYVGAMQTYAQYAQVPYGIRMLKQFKLVVDSAAASHSHLFSAAELADLSVFQRLDDDAQNLYVRLCWRRQRQSASESRWFPVALLCTRYKHIRDVRKAANTLIQSHRSADDSESARNTAGLLESSLSTNLAFEQVFEQIIDGQTVAALRQICAALRVVMKSGLNRAEIISVMRRSVCQQRTLSGLPLSHDLRTQNIFHSVAGEFVRLSPPFFNAVQRMYRLFFLSSDVSDSSISVAATPMLLESLGRQKFAQTIVRGKREEIARRLFPSRAAFLAYDNALRLLDAIRIATDDYDGVVYGKLDTPLAMFYLQQARQRLARELTNPHTTADEQTHNVTVIPTVTFPSDYERYFTNFHPARVPQTRPDELAFIDHFRAATVYANACYYGVKSLEKNHRYAEAATIMFELLSQQHATQRRGFWWNRLSILFATHFKEKQRALWICRLALDDEFVRTGDRVEVERRCLRLWKDKAGGNRTGVCPVTDVLPLPTSLQRSASKRRRSISIEAEDEDDIDDADVMIDETRTPVVCNNRLIKSARTSSSSAVTTTSSSNISTVSLRGRPLNREIGVKSHFIGYDNAQCSVEQLALQYYAMEANGGWNGMHCENSLLMTLFGIVLWPVIFADIPEVFQSEYQDSPLDLCTDSFYRSRRQLIADELTLLCSSDLSRFISSRYWKYFGQRCRGVQWSRWTVQTLQTVATSFGARALSGIFQVIAKDYAYWSGGLPDLCLYSPATVLCDQTTQVNNHSERHVSCSDDDGDVQIISSSVPLPSPHVPRESVRLVEVKGPRDRLSAQQLAWLHQLAHFVHVQVCFVKEESGQEI